MAHEIFISYSSRHRELTRALAATLEAQHGAGSVWWDHELEARGPYATQIRAALDAARVVVVIWTAGARVSEYVYAEASAAHAARKLVNVRPADTAFDQIPEPFNIHHVADLEDTGRILRDVASVMAGRPLPTIVPLHELYRRQYGARLVDPGQSALPADVRDLGPSQLLQARYALVDYADATGQRAGLLDWALNHPRRAAGRLVHGPGGAGKTRLLIDLAAALRRDHGWLAGFVDRVPASADDAQRRQRSQALRQLVERGDEPGLLLVLDDAEGRRDELLELAQWIEARPDRDRRPLRLVLLARSAGEWWQRLADEDADLQTLFRVRPGQPAVVELGAFDSAGQRLSLFDASCAAYGRVLGQQGLATVGRPVPPALRRRIERGEGRTRPLAIQMEALVWLAGGDEGPSSGTAELLDQVFGVERRHWVAVCGALDEAAITELERAVAQITLVHGVPSRAEAEALLAADGYYEGLRQAPAALAPALGRLARLCGDGTDGGGLRPLEPEPVGEHLVARAADERLLDACVGWIDARAERADGDAPARRARLVTVLQRSTAPEHGPRRVARAADLLERLLQRHLAGWAPAVVSTIVETPGELLRRLEARVDGLDEPALSALDEALPYPTLALAAVAADVARRRLEHERAGAAGDEVDETAHRARLAMRWANRGLRLSALGRGEDARAATDEAVRIYRDLAGVRPDDFLPELAGALSNLGIVLSGLGRREDALAAAEEAVRIRRELARARPERFRPGLARSLNNLGNMLSGLGRREDALAASAEAVSIDRDLAAVRPEAFRDRLAAGLANLGNRLSDLGRREEALAAGDEAVRIYRELARSRPDAFVPELANSLANTGALLSDLGRHEDALAATDESVQIRRTLARTWPDAFLPELAASLTNLGNVLSALGRREDALAATDEAVRLYREQARLRPDAFLPDLASSLAGLGNHLSDVGRSEEALSASDEAVRGYRALAGARPDAFLPDLALALNNLGNRLSDLGRLEEALDAMHEAVRIFRRLVEARPEAFRPQLAASLDNLGNRLSGLGRHEAALAATEEALRIRRDLARERPGAFLPDLARTLGNLGALLPALGRLEDARAATDEAVRILRGLAAARPDAVMPELARSLGNLGNLLHALGRRDDALAAAGEAVTIRRVLAEARPEVFGPELATSLANLGEMLSDIGRRDDGLAATDEAVRLYRDLARARPRAFGPGLARSLGSRAKALAAAGRNAAAAASAEEGLQALLPLLRSSPEALGELALALAQAHRDCADAAAQQPNASLLAEIAGILGRQRGVDGDG